MNTIKLDYPYISYNYFLISDWGCTGFSKISGLTLNSCDLKSFSEGGAKDIHMLLEQNKSFNTMTLEKGVGKTDFLKYLGPLKSVVLVCMSAKHKITKVYFATEAVLQRISISDLDANSSSVLISSMSIAYRNLDILDISDNDDQQNSLSSKELSVSSANVSDVKNEATSKNPDTSATKGKSNEHSEVETYKSANKNAKAVSDKSESSITNEIQKEEDGESLICW